MRFSRMATVALLVAVQPAAAAPEGAPVPARELIYCADLMSHEERQSYRAGMQAARTAAEKEALRSAHRRDMQARTRDAGREGQCEPTGRQWRGGRDK